MAAKGMTSRASLSFSSQHQVLGGASVSPNDPVSSAKHGAFTRAHSLEIPDADDDGDTFMDDLEFQDTPDVMCTSEEFWHEIVEMPIEMEFKRPKCDSDLDFNCYDSPAAVDITDMDTRAAFEQHPETPKRAKRISNKQKIAALRDEIKGLAAQVSALETASLRAEEGGSVFVMSRSSQLWEPIAARQLERRQRAEEENAKLREMMKVQVREAGRLRRVLKRRTNHIVGTYSL